MENTLEEIENLIDNTADEDIPELCKKIRKLTLKKEHEVIDSPNHE